MRSIGITNLGLKAVLFCLSSNQDMCAKRVSALPHLIPSSTLWPSILLSYSKPEVQRSHCTSSYKPDLLKPPWSRTLGSIPDTHNVLTTAQPNLLDESADGLFQDQLRDDAFIVKTSSHHLRQASGMSHHACTLTHSRRHTITYDTVCKYTIALWWSAKSY